MTPKTLSCRILTFILFWHFQNDTEKSASDPGTPPQTSKPGDRSTTKSPMPSPKASNEPRSPEVKRQQSFYHWTHWPLSWWRKLSCHRRRPLQRRQQSDSSKRTVTRPLARGGDPQLAVMCGSGRVGVRFGSEGTRWWTPTGCVVIFFFF